jgi:hypothetical protein
VLELCCARATRVGAQKHTTAQVQPAKERVLDSECESAARRKLRRRFGYIPVRGDITDWQFHTTLMWNQKKSLCMLRGVWRNRRYGGTLSLDLAA